MFKHYIRISLRYLYRNIGITAINITGLAIGIAIFILIIHYVINELKYDKFNSRQETVGWLEWSQESSLSNWTTSAMGYDATNAIPEIKEFVRVQTWTDFYLEYEENKFRVQRAAVVDSNIFNLFDLELLQGDPATALKDPFTIVLTNSFAEKIFGDGNPMGKILKSGTGKEFMVTGIVKNPENFHIQFDLLLSFITLGKLYGEERLYTYKTYQYGTYFLLDDNVNIDTVSRKLDVFFHELFYKMYGPSDDSLLYHAYYRPLREIYFARNVNDFGVKHGNIQFVIIFIIIAFFIIIIACINFINLSTARATIRSMEVGIRKVVGSDKSKLIFQFLGESMIITLIGTLLGLLLVELILPVFENMIGTSIRIVYLENPINLLFVIFGIIVIGLMAGLYPAFYLTRFNPVSVMKGERVAGKSAGILRKFLIIFQFSISIILIIGTIVLYKQLHYLRNKDLGFNKEHLITFEITEQISQSKEMFRENLLKYPGIRGVSFSYTIPGSSGNYEGFSIEGEEFNPNVYSVDPDYLNVMGIELADGRNFSWDLVTDKLNVCLINEESARILKMDSLVGKHFDHPSWYITVFPVTQFEIIGIMKDFHFKSLRTPIEPLIFGWNEDWFSYANVKISSENIRETLSYIEKEWKAISPQYPFEYSFMDENFDRMYRSDENLGRIFSYFAGLAVFIAMLGLFGLSAFFATQRTKEIGIRKVMGASVSRISFLLVREFTVLILIASVIAWPVAWFWATKWLQEFAYKTEVGIMIFIIATFIAIFIALITVVSQTLRAANTNPAEALRYE